MRNLFLFLLAIFAVLFPVKSEAVEVDDFGIHFSMSVLDVLTRLSKEDRLVGVYVEKDLDLIYKGEGALKGSSEYKKLIYNQSVIRIEAISKPEREYGLPDKREFFYLCRDNGKLIRYSIYRYLPESEYIAGAYESEDSPYYIGDKTGDKIIGSYKYGKEKVQYEFLRKSTLIHTDLNAFVSSGATVAHDFFDLKDKSKKGGEFKLCDGDFFLSVDEKILNHIGSLLWRQQ